METGEETMVFSFLHGSFASQFFNLFEEIHLQAAIEHTTYTHDLPSPFDVSGTHTRHADTRHGHGDTGHGDTEDGDMGEEEGERAFSTTRKCQTYVRPPTPVFFIGTPRSDPGVGDTRDGTDGKDGDVKEGERKGDRLGDETPVIRSTAPCSGSGSNTTTSKRNTIVVRDFKVMQSHADGETANRTEQGKRGDLDESRVMSEEIGRHEDTMSITSFVDRHFLLEDLGLNYDLLHLIARFMKFRSIYSYPKILQNLINNENPFFASSNLDSCSASRSCLGSQNSSLIYSRSGNAVHCAKILTHLLLALLLANVAVYLSRTEKILIGILVSYLTFGISYFVTANIPRTRFQYLEIEQFIPLLQGIYPTIVLLHSLCLIPLFVLNIVAFRSNFTVKIAAKSFIPIFVVSLIYSWILGPILHSAFIVIAKYVPQLFTIGEIWTRNYVQLRHTQHLVLPVKWKQQFFPKNHHNDRSHLALLIKYGTDSDLLTSPLAYHDNLRTSMSSTY